MTPTRVSDVVWQQLDRNAGRMSRRTFRLFLAGAVTLAVLTAATVLSWRTITSPLKADAGEFGASYTRSPMTFTVEFPVHNIGLIPVTIEGVGRDGKAVTVLSARAVPEKVGPGESTTIQLAYSVSDCRDFVHGTWPLPIRIHRPWGTQTVYVTPPYLPNPDAPSSYSYSGDRDPYQLEWQESYIRQICAPTTE
jgi:hypothetical protein